MPLPAELKVLPKDVEQLLPNQGDLAVFFNGVYVPELSSLCETASLNCEWGKRSQIKVKANQKAELTIISIYGIAVTESEFNQSNVERQAEIFLEDGAELTLFEAHLAKNELPYIVQNKIQVSLNPNAKLFQARAFWLGNEAEFNDELTGGIKKDGVYELLTLIIGGTNSKSLIDLKLKEPASALNLFGLSLGAGNSSIQNQTRIEHQVGETFCVQNYKGLYAGSARGAFDGQISIFQDAQKSNAQQIVKNIVIGDKAQVDVKPQLEVLADDVKAAHGATIGRLSEEELFYLKARAIDENLAKAMLSEGFCNEVVTALSKESLVNRLKPIVRQALAQTVKGVE
jgi:Fe-S cluster assembly protein SufD